MIAYIKMTKSELDVSIVVGTRPELIKLAPVIRLISTGTKDLRAWVAQLCEDPTLYANMSRRVSRYGDGRAAERVVEVLFPSDRQEAACTVPPYRDSFRESQ